MQSVVEYISRNVKTCVVHSFKETVRGGCIHNSQKREPRTVDSSISHTRSRQGENDCSQLTAHTVAQYSEAFR